ncbi:MAG: F0F1 ATP synthase subunit epsilon [Burkholderiales bacterium]
MAEERVEFELVSPERLLLSEAVEMVVVPGAEGEFGVLPRHAPMISTLRPGVIRVYENGAVSERIFVAGGFAEVTPARCTVLADQAVPVADIDRTEVEKSLSEAREDLAEAKSEDESGAVQRRIAIAEAMLKAE